MAFDFSAYKAKTRRIVHDYLSMEALYDAALGVDPIPVRVRWHNKMARYGDMGDGGYAEVVEGVNRLIFNTDELDKKGIVLRKGARVHLTAQGYEGTVLILDVEEPRDGPVETIWGVVAA